MYCALPSARRRLSRSSRYLARSASGSNGAEHAVAILLRVLPLLLRLAAGVVWIGAALRAPMALASDPSLLAAAAFAAFVVQVGWVMHRIGRFGAVTTLAYPLVLVGFIALFIRSTALTARGRPVPWRGRLVRVRA